MKNLFINLSLTLLTFYPFTLCYSQDSVMVSSTGKFGMTDYIQFSVDFLKDVEFERMVDIGSGNMEHILHIVNEYPDKQYVFEDIDSGLCHHSRMLEKISEWKLSNVNPDKISFQIGDTSATGLESSSCDIVMMAGLFHELRYNELLFDDIKSILSKDGRLIIYDALYEENPGTHRDCKYPFLTIEEWNQMIEQLDLVIEREWRLVGIKDGRLRDYESRIVLCSFK